MEEWDLDHTLYLLKDFLLICLHTPTGFNATTKLSSIIFDPKANVDAGADTGASRTKGESNDECPASLENALLALSSKL